MNDNAIWNGFADAVVRLDLPTGRVVLEPRPPGDIGMFPFDAPVHIITAYNPGGVETDEMTNLARHHSLSSALTGHDVFPTTGSAPDGSMPEPGFGVRDMTLSDALALASNFGQLALYRWTADALSIVDVDGTYRRRHGWSLLSRRQEWSSRVVNRVGLSDREWVRCAGSAVVPIDGAPGAQEPSRRCAGAGCSPHRPTCHPTQRFALLVP